MPAKDLYHDAVKKALVKDGWTITHDPFPLKWGKKDLFVDLGAEKLLTAEKEGRQIAVEVKSFLGQSDVEDLRNALGQFVLYHDILEERDPEGSFSSQFRRVPSSESSKNRSGRS